MIPPIPIVLTATDFSNLASATVGYAYSVVDDGGTVHLLHVIEAVEPRVQPNPLYAHYTPGKAPTREERATQHAELEARLRALVPPEAEARMIRTEAHVVEADEVAEAIVEEAERVGASLVCVGGHGRGALAGALLGSVARDVAHDGRRPVLIVREPAGAA